MYGDESNPKSSAERGRSQRGSTNDPYQNESERYGSRGSEYASNPWESSRGFEEYGQGGMGQYSGQYSRVYENQPWNTELGAGQYGTDRSGSDINVEQSSQNRAPRNQMPPSGQPETRSGYPYSGGQVTGSSQESSRGSEQVSGSEMTDYGRERAMQGTMPVPRMVSDESRTESRESRRATEEDITSRSSQPAMGSQMGAGRTPDMSDQPTGRQNTGRGFWDRLVGSRHQEGSNQPPGSNQPAYGMGSEQCYVDESGGIVDLDPACGQYGRHEYGAQMGYGHEVYQSGDYRVEGQPWMSGRGAGSEAGRRFEQASPMMQGREGQMRRDVAQPPMGQQQYQPSYGQQAGAAQYSGTGPEQFGWRRPEEAQGFVQGQRPSEQYQTAPSYGQMGYAGAQGDLTDYGREIAIGGMPLYFTEMREDEMRRVAIDEAMRRQRGMGQQYQPSYQQQQYQPSEQQSYSQQPGMQFAGTRPEQFRQRSTEEIWGFQEGQRPSEQYQPTQAPSYGQMGTEGTQGEFTGYGREIAAAGGMPLYFQEMRESEMRQSSMEQQPSQQQYQSSYETGRQYQQPRLYGMGQEMNAPEYGRSGEFGHEGWTGRYGEYGVRGVGAGTSQQQGMESRYEEPRQAAQQSQAPYSEQYTGAIPERYGQMGSRQMQGELTPVGWEIAMGGMPLYFQEIKEAEWRQRALEDRQMGMGTQYQPSYQGAQTRQMGQEQFGQAGMQSQQYGQPYQGGQYAQQTGQSYGMGPQVQGPYSQAVSQIPYSQPGMSFTGETFGPAAFSRGSYYGPMGLQQYGEPVQRERIPEPTSIWRSEGMGEAGMQGQRSMGGFTQGQYQPAYGQRGMEGQYQQPQQYQQSQQYQQPQYESESSRGKSQYGMGSNQYAQWEGEPCMMGNETGQYSCNQFVTQKYGGEVSPEQPRSGTEPLSRRAGSEMTPYGQERTLEGAMPLYRQGQQESQMRQQETGQPTSYGQSRYMGSQPYSGQWQTGQGTYGSQEVLSGETGMYSHRGSERLVTGGRVYPSEVAEVSGITSGTGQYRPESGQQGTGGGVMGHYSQGVSEYSGIAPTEGAIGQTYGPTQGDTENLSQAGSRYYGQGNPYSQEPEDVTSPYGTKPGSVGREGQQMGQTACLMAYETGPYSGQSSYNAQQGRSLADFRKDQCGL